MLATLLRPHSGTARVFGHDVVGESDAVRNRVSYNPITHLVSAIRGLMSGTMPAGTSPGCSWGARYSSQSLPLSLCASTGTRSERIT